jgi:hypothetical protein
VDRIFETYLERGIKPLVEIGFMPEALSVKPQPYRHEWGPDKPYSNIFAGWAYPPRDYGKWAELVYQWARHCVEKYGKQQVESWYWEVWNEPNIGYWKGTPEEFYLCAQVRSGRAPWREFQGAVTWAFEFEDQFYFDGFRDLATNGIDKPVLNVFRMFGMMGGDRLTARSSGGAELDGMIRGGVKSGADIGALASRKERSMSVMVWHYHDDNVPAAPADIALTLPGWGGTRSGASPARSSTGNWNAPVNSN